MIHSNGIAAMFWLKWLVTAESSKAPQAAVSSQTIFSFEVGGGFGGSSGLAASSSSVGVSAIFDSKIFGSFAGSPTDALRLLRLIAPQASTNTRNPADH